MFIIFSATTIQVRPRPNSKLSEKSSVPKTLSVNSMESLYDEIKIADEHTPTSIGIIYVIIPSLIFWFTLRVESSVN